MTEEHHPLDRSQVSNDINQTFASIIFAGYFALWISSFDSYLISGNTPRFFFAQLLNKLQIGNIDPGILLPHYGTLQTLADVISIIIFLPMVVTLWWWYCILIPTLHRRDRFGHYLLDYAIFGAFALSFRYWGTYDVFLVAICIAGFLSKGRLKPITKALEIAQDYPDHKNKEAYADLLKWITFLRNYLKFGVTSIALLAILVIEWLAITGTVSDKIYIWTAKGQFLMLTLMIIVLLMSWRIWNLAYQQDFKDVRNIIEEEDRKASARPKWWRARQSPRAPV